MKKAMDHEVLDALHPTEWRTPLWLAEVIAKQRGIQDYEDLGTALAVGYPKKIYHHANTLVKQGFADVREIVKAHEFVPLDSYEFRLTQQGLRKRVEAHQRSAEGTEGYMYVLWKSHMTWYRKAIEQINKHNAVSTIMKTLEEIRNDFDLKYGSVPVGSLVRIMLKEGLGVKRLPNCTFITGPIAIGYKGENITGIYEGYTFTGDAPHPSLDPPLHFEVFGEDQHSPEPSCTFSVDCSEIADYDVTRPIRV